MTATMIISWIAVVVTGSTGLSLLITRDWRWSLTLLAIEYVAVFWLTQLHWTLSMAAVKLVAGWMTVTILGITRSALDEKVAPLMKAGMPESHIFRILAAALVLLLVISGTPTLAALLPGIGLAEVAGSLTLMGMGLLLLGFTRQILPVSIALLSVLAGFEILYAAVENAVLVAALLALINLGLALVGSYLLIAAIEGDEI